MSKRVEFVNYTGSYPCLCSGEVTLKIDGEIIKFCKYKSDSERNGRPYLSLISGGEAYFDSDYNTIITYGPWGINLDPRYAELEKEILEVINDNVPEGCCGGCL